MQKRSFHSPALCRSSDLQGSKRVGFGLGVKAPQQLDAKLENDVDSLSRRMESMPPQSSSPERAAQVAMTISVLLVFLQVCFHSNGVLAAGQENSG
jgi:hypothetical protein